MATSVTSAPPPPTRTAATAPARLAAVGAVLVALVGALLAAGGQLDPLVGDSGVVVRRGTVEMTTGDTWSVVPEGRRLPAGATLRVPAGTATLALAGGDEMDLAAGARLVLDRPLHLAAGSAVVRSTDDVTLDAGSVRTVGRGTWRVDGAGPARVAAYRGSATTTDVADRETLVRAFEELQLRDGITDGAPRPYVYATSDPFDPTYLAPAFGIDDLVAALRSGLAADYGTAPQDPAFYLDFDVFDGEVTAALGDIGFTFDGPRFGPPADVLVAAVMTEAIVTRAGLPPAEAAAAVRDLRLAGATWGLIGMHYDLTASDVRAASDAALTRRRETVQAGTAVPVITPGPSGSATGPGDADSSPGSPPDDGGGSSTEPGSGGSGDGSTDGGGSSGSPGPVGSVVDSVEDVVPLEDVGDGTVAQTVDDTAALVDEVIGGVTGGLQPSSPGTDSGDSATGGVVGGLVDDTGAVVEDLGDTVGGLLGG